ncbi:MAG: helix-turn-helix domain-containing protein [Bacillota bacterium]|nr:helix-turn-helix domain-containing protein [Bacillota bacterium]
MVNDFSRTLSFLRQEKKISQRQAASDLSVSQALLSHYENGVREPGLKFVINAAAYYGVSCDYLLGRTMSREGASVSAEELPDFSAEKGNLLKGNIFAVLQKKLVANSVALVLELAGKTDDKAFISDVSCYISIAVYKMFRYLYLSDPKQFSVSEESFSSLCDAEAKLCEMRIKCRLSGKNPDGSACEPVSLPAEMSHDYLIREFPQLAQSLFALLQTVSDKVSEKLK